MAARILQGDVFKMLPTIEPGSVDCCVTSPPYWQLRSYLPKDHPLKKFELGSERTPAEYVSNMVRVFDLVRDCLADHGTCWINVGDSYNGYYAGQYATSLSEKNQHARHVPEDGYGARAKDLECGQLCLIPQRLAIALQYDGWIIRSIPIWHKPAPMPQSVTGWAWRRCRVKVKECGRANTPGRNGDLTRQGAGVSKRAQREEYEATKHEQWSDCPGCKKCKPNGGYVLRKGSWRPTSSYEPILMLAKSAKYFCDGEPVKTRAIYPDDLRRPLGSAGAWEVDGREQGENGGGKPYDHDASSANLRDVWRIAAEPLKAGHYAAYPTELVRKCLQAGVSEKGYCPKCGGPWVRVVEVKYGIANHGAAEQRLTASGGALDGGTQCSTLSSITSETKTIGWRPSCTCHPSEPRPGLVLDPFCGSGRTAQAAGWLGMDFIGTELNPAYVEMAQEILSEDNPLFMRK